MTISTLPAPRYERRLRALSSASSRQHFDPFLDIDWDAPEHRIEPDDPRWELPPTDPLGATDWYRALPASRRARLGLDVVATQMKVGVQFEALLSAGLLQLASVLSDDRPEVRYVFHEIIEESRHIQMFREFIRRSSMTPSGLRPWEQLLARRVPRMGRVRPEQLFIHVLAGELPIDHVQRVALRDQPLHPLLRTVLRAHVTEEARHVAFAESFLRRHVPRMSTSSRRLLAIKTPIIARTTADSILRPTARLLSEHGVPRDVARQVYGARGAFADLRCDGLRPLETLCAEVGLMTPAAGWLWRRLRIRP